jgi:hypothetical protein
MGTTTKGTTSLQVATQQSKTIAEYEALIGGMQTELTAVDVLYINGTPWKKADLIARFQKRLDAAKSTKDARTTLLASVGQEKEVKAEADPLRNGTKGFLKSYYGKKSPMLQKFGFSPDRTPKQAPSVKAAAVAKSKATKEARGIKGKKQRARITTAPATASGTTASAPGATAAATPAPAATPAVAAVAGNAAPAATPAAKS